MARAAADAWPGADRRQPPLGDPHRALRRPLADWLREEARLAAGRGRYRVLDVGCGVKPYYPFFAERADEYVGVDVVENPYADLHGAAEALPVADAAYDVVLCTQLLEHADDPDAVVRELHRVTAPGGRVLASTHGIMYYHPNPDDLWRWTHAGLERLFRRNGEWASLTVTPGAGTASALGMLVSVYVHLLFKQLHAARLAAAPIAGVNALAAALDRRVALLHGTAPGSIAINYHVAAEKAG